MSTVLHVSPAVIRWARISAGIHLEEAARSAHIDPELLTKWEDEQATPTPRQLEQLADKYKRPVSVLLRTNPPNEPALPVDFRRLPQGQRSLSAASRLAIRRARRVQRIYRELAQDLPLEPHLLPTGLRQDAEAAGGFARSAIGVSLETQLSWRSTADAVRHWRAALEATGVLVLRFSMPAEELRGFSIPGAPPVIAMSNQDPHPAQSFTLFHEWCHLLLDESGLCRPNELSRTLRGDDEVFCNAFAGAFLVPMPALLSHPLVAALRAHDSEAGPTATAVARAFSVSRFVVLRRLLAAQVVSHDEYGRIVSAWVRQPRPVRRSNFGPAPAVRAVSELGHAFVASVITARQRGVIGETDAADYLSLGAKHLERVSELVAV